MMNGKETQINPDTTDFHSYWNRYGGEYEVLGVEKTVYNKTHFFAGTMDQHGVRDGKTYIGDYKTGSIYKKKLERAFRQMAFYSLCDEVQADELIVFPISTDRKPVIEKTEVWQKAVLKDLEEFKRRLGL